MSADASYAAQLLARGVENLAEVRDATTTRRMTRDDDAIGRSTTDGCAPVSRVRRNLRV